MSERDKGERRRRTDTDNSHEARRGSSSSVRAEDITEKTTERLERREPPAQAVNSREALMTDRQMPGQEKERIMKAIVSLRPAISPVEAGDMREMRTEVRAAIVQAGIEVRAMGTETERSLQPWGVTIDTTVRCQQQSPSRIERMLL